MPMLRVLVVDDYPDSAETACALLAMLGHDCRFATSGAKALEEAAQFLPDVAILDIGLPVMDGYELAERIRAQLGDAAPELVALTGYGQPSDRDRSARAGFALHLVKPVDLQGLLRYLRGDQRGGVA